MHSNCDRQVHEHIYRQFLELTAGKPNMPYRILMSDNVNFYWHSAVNKNKFWYWASEKLGTPWTSPIQLESSCLVSGIMYCITGFISLNMKESKLLQSYYIPTLTCLKHFSCQGYRIFQDTAICGFRGCYYLPFFLEGYTQGKGWLMRSYKWESEKKSSIFQKKYFWKWCTASWFTCTNAFNGCT